MSLYCFHCLTTGIRSLHSGGCALLRCICALDRSRSVMALRSAKRRKGGMLMDIVFYMIFIAELIVLHPELVQAAALFFAYAKQVLAHR